MIWWSQGGAAVGWSSAGDRLKRQRQKFGFTVADAAARVGVPERTFRRWEETDECPPDMLQVVLKTLDTDRRFG